MYDINLIKKEIKKLETKKQKLIEFSSYLTGKDSISYSAECDRQINIINNQLDSLNTILQNEHIQFQIDRLNKLIENCKQDFIK